MKLGIIGAAGNMAGAIINGILKSEIVSPSDLYLFDTQVSKLNHLVSIGANLTESNGELVEKSDYIFLAVKPQIINDVLFDIKDYIKTEHCVISIAAGVKIETIEKSLDCKCAVVRVMPNTPLMVGEGASGIAFNSAVSDLQKEKVLSIFNVSGLAVCCNENDIDVVTAISGSSPAYFLRMMKVMANKAEELGLDKDDAYKLIIQSMIGSATLLRESQFSADELIKMITSPKGTTLEALLKLDELNFDNTVKEAVQACYDRAVELGKQA